MLSKYRVNKTIKILTSDNIVGLLQELMKMYVVERQHYRIHSYTADMEGVQQVCLSHRYFNAKHIYTL
jgi:hypothetical protein